MASNKFYNITLKNLPNISPGDEFFRPIDLKRNKSSFK